MKFSEKLLRYLHSVGIEYIFGIVGREASAILFDEYADKVKFILTRHELTAGVAASAMSRFSKSPQACFVTLGPGITNIMTAIATAAIDRYPIVIIATQIETNCISYNDAHQCLDNISLVKPITKYAYELKKPSELKEALKKAIQASMTHPLGPSMISIPIDTLSSEVEDKENNLCKDLGRKISSTKSTTFIQDLKKAVNLFENSKYPLIIVGDVVTKDNEMPKLIRSFSEKYNIPVITTYSSKGVLPANHQLNYGSINSYANVILEQESKKIQFNEADLLLILGYDLAEYYPNAWKDTKLKKIINIIPYMNNSLATIKPDINIIGPLKESLEYLKVNIPAQKYSPYSISEMKKRIKEKLSDRKNYPEGIMVNQIVGILNEHYDDYILANDIGMHRHLTAIYYQPRKPGNYVTSAGLASFGTGLPLGIGAKMANSKKNVVVITGDGGFHSNSGDLETAARLKLKMTIILLNSQANSLIHRYQLVGKNRRHYQKSYAFNNVDFAKLAEANGCQGIKVNNLNEFKKALIKADKFSGPTLIEVKVFYPDLYINSFSVSRKKDN